MTNNKNVERYLWISVVTFVTYLLLSSFILSKNLLELVYLIVLYTFIIVVKIIENKK